MEAVMLKIISECTNKQTAIKDVAQDAHDLLVAQQLNPITEIYDLRDKCLTALEQSLDAKTTRLVQCGLEGLQLLLRDNQLHSLEGIIEKPEQTLPMQVLHTLSCLPDWSQEPDTQCHCLTIILQILCSSSWIILSETVITAIELCLSTFCAARQMSVKMAARATVSQVLDSYCTGLYKEQAEDAAEDDYRNVFEEVTKLVSFCTDKLNVMSSSCRSADQSPGLLFVVDALYTVLSVQSVNIRKHEPFMNLLWQGLCPAVISLLGTPHSHSSQPTSTSPSRSVGRGKSAVSGEQPIFDSPNVAKCVYMSCGELLRIMGCIPNMRSVLEALFHRVFLFPPVNKRVEALRAFKKILSFPERIVDLLIIIPDSGSSPEKQNSTDAADLNLWKILLDCIVECSFSSNLDVTVAAVQCADALLSSMTSLIEEQAQFMSPSVIDEYNKRFRTLKQSDVAAVSYHFEGTRSKKIVLPQLSLDEPSSPNTDDIEMTIPSFSSNESPQKAAHDTFESNESETQIADNQEPAVDECMKSVAERIGSVLRRTQVESHLDRQEHFMKIQAALNEKMAGDFMRPIDSVTEQLEVTRAIHLVNNLAKQVQQWTKMRSVLEVDEEIQRFASTYCKDYMERQEKEFQGDQSQPVSVLNADAVYLLTFASLRLCYRLEQTKFYASITPQNQDIIIPEEAFMKEVLGSRCIIFASETLVRNVYRQLIKRNLFQGIGLTEDESQISCLIAIVEDYDGQSCQLLSDVQRLEKASKRTTLTLHCLAARKLCRRALTFSWEGLVIVLSSLVEAIREETGRSLSSFVHSLVKKSAIGSKYRDHALLISDGLTAGLGGLQRLAHLCNTLKLQTRSGWIFGKLVEVSCPLDDLRAGCIVKHRMFRKTNTAIVDWSLRVPDVLSIEIVLDSAIDAGTHAAECWTHVIRCTEYVWELERYFFGRPELAPGAKLLRFGPSAKKHKVMTANEQNDDDELSNLVSHFAIPSSPIQSGTACTVSDVLDQCGGIKPDSGGQIEPQITARILCLLMAKVDSFYENVTRCLNLRAVREFTDALVTASQSRLLYSADEGLLDRSTLLQRLSQTLMRLGRSGRPLVHVMLVWANSSLHFIEAACTHESAIANKAISSLHECVSSLLSCQSGELDGFRFNESLLNPFQHALCLEMIDPETQDQIVSVIAEFVEMYPEQIGSGWRPLFGSLKAVRNAADIGTNSQDQTSSASVQLIRMHKTVLDVFETFLKTENWGVFCLAALDCINCLLHYLQATDLVVADGNDSDDERPEYSQMTLSLCRPALDYLRRLHTLLGNLFPMNRLPVFHLLHRLLLRERSTQKVDAHIVGLHLDRLPKLSCVLAENGFFGQISDDLDSAWLEQLADHDNSVIPWSNLPVTQLAIVEAWLTLIEGLTGAVVTCPRSIQPDVLQSLYEMCESIRICPGLEFGAYCLSHLVLPMLQNWLRREARFSSGWRENSPSVRNFKQAVGLSAESVVGYLADKPDADCNLKLLRDTLCLLVECVAQPSEVISRLGCSCLRHLILSSANNFGEAQWSIVCQSLWKATIVTLHPIRTLMVHFYSGSEEYYGDYGQVQVALRKDSNPREAGRVRALAQQVFLLDSQKFVENLEDHPDMLSQSQHSIVLLLHPEKESINSELHINRLPFRDIVISLLSHQLLLQMIGSLLLKNTKLVVGGVSSLLIKQLIAASDINKQSDNGDIWPGWLKNMKADHLSSLFLCLDASFQIGFEFDQRPGLKFLLQKVFNSTVAANLYKQAVTSWTLRALTLYELAKRSQLSSEQVKNVCRSPTKNMPRWFNDLDQQSKYTAMLCDCYMRICHQLCQVERTIAQGKQHEIGQLDEPFVFLLAAPEELSITNNKADDVENNDATAEEEDKLLSNQQQHDETVYSIVDNEQLAGILSEYKRRKQQATMPVKPVVRENPFSKTGDAVNVEVNDDVADQTLKKEQNESVLKDGDARCLAWSEMALNLFQLLMSEKDDTFRQMLPVFYSSIVHLTSGSAQPRVRQSLADFIYRLNETFGLLGKE